MESETEKSAKCACGCKCKKFAVAILVILIAGIVCWHIHRPKHHPEPIAGLTPGTQCILHLRQDALGNNDAPIEPLTVIDGVPVVRVVLIAMNHEAIIVDNDGQQRYWIPKSSILLIQYEKPTPGHHMTVPPPG